MTYWKKVVFTDESKIKISGSEMSDRRVLVWRKSTEKSMPAGTLGTVKTGEQSIMVLGWMSNDDIGPLVITEGSVTGKNTGTFCKGILGREWIRYFTVFVDSFSQKHKYSLPPQKELCESCIISLL